MTDKSLKTYVGEDRLPVNDLTEYVNWPESRFMTMAYNGDSSASEIVLRDENGEMGTWVDMPITIGARNEVEVLHGSNFLYRGRLVERTWGRGEQKAYKAREVRAEAEDVNVELRGLIVDQWVRPEETDVARVTALKTAYLSGAQRVGANLSTTFVSASNSQTLPAKTYTQTDPLGVMQDVAFQTHKMFFVTIDKQLFYDGYDSSAYLSPFSITDDVAELKASPTTKLSIIPDSGPLFSINGRQFIDGVRLYYGAGTADFVDVTHPGLASAKAYWRETVYAPDTITNATEAANLAETLLQERSQDAKTLTLSVGHANGGPLTEAQIGSIKAGHLIGIKSRVLPGPAYIPQYMRIVTLQWHMPLPGQYFATLKLEHPERAFGVGTKPGPRAPDDGTPGTAPTVSGGAGTGNNGSNQGSVSVPSSTGGLVAVLLSDGDVTTTTATWKPDSTSGAADQAMTIIGSVTHPTPASGTNNDGEKLLVAWLANPTASTANTPSIAWNGNPDTQNGSVFGYWTVSSSTTPTLVTAYGTGSQYSVTAGAASDLVLDCGGYRVWSLGDASNTPVPQSGQTTNWAYPFTNSAGRNDSAWFGGNSTGAGARATSLVLSTNWVAAAIVFAGVGAVAGDTTEPVGGGGTADPGTSGVYSPINHVHEHGDLSVHSDETHHHASSMEFTPVGDVEATNVQDAIAEVASEAGITEADVRDTGHWEVIVSGSAPPVAVTNEAEDDWVYGWSAG